MRVDTYQQIDRIRPELICGEEPQMSVRVRHADWHLDDDATLHDAAKYNYTQWWTRILLGGRGFTQRPCVRDNRLPVTAQLVGKFGELQRQMNFLFDWVRQVQSRLIGFKKCVT